MIDLQKLDAVLSSTLPKVEERLRKLQINEFFIAGGFLRDTLLGNSPKDVDVFVSFDYAQHLLTNEQLEHYADLEVFDVIPLEIDDEDINYELIIIDDKWGRNTQSVCDRFDNNLCKVGVNNKGKLYISDEFKKDVTDRTITFTRSSGPTPEHRYNRIVRMKQKYPDFSVVEEDSGAII